MSGVDASLAAVSVEDACGLVLRASVEGASQFFFSDKATLDDKAQAARSLAYSGFAVVD